MACTLVAAAQLDLSDAFVFTGGVDIDNAGAFRIEDAGGDHWLTIASANHAADRTATVPILAGASEFLMTNATSIQTIVPGLIITGNLTVNGTTTTINTATLSVEDPIIEIGSAGADVDGGLLLNRAATDAGLQFTQSAGRWQAGLIGSLSNIMLASDIGSTIAAYDALLEDIADIAGTFTADGEIIVGTGVGTAALESGQTLRQSISTFLHDERIVTSTPYTVVAADHGRVLVCESGAVQVDLPAVASSTDFVLSVKRNGSGGSVTIDGNSGDTIDGSTTKVLGTDHDSVTLYCDGAEWHIVSEINYASSPTTLAGLTDTDITTPGGGNLLRYDGSDSWDDTTFTIPDTIGINELWYASAANVLGVISAANSSLLVTNGSGVPSLGTDIPTAVTIGTAYIYRVGGTDVAVTDGGTGLSAISANDILYADGANSIAALSPGANQLLISNGSSVPGFTSTLPAVTLSGAVTGGGNDLTNIGTLNIGTPTDRTIATGVCPAPAAGFVALRGEGAAADVLNTFADTGAVVGDLLWLVIQDEDITISHNATPGGGEDPIWFIDEADHTFRGADNNILKLVYGEDTTWHVISGGGGGVPATEMWVDQSETGDNSTTDWPLTVPAVQRSIMVFVNGLYCQDYTETVSGGYTTNIVLGVAQPTGYDIRFKYMRANPS